jgi:hypothetical protein
VSLGLELTSVSKDGNDGFVRSIANATLDLLMMGGNRIFARNYVPLLTMVLCSMVDGVGYVCWGKASPGWYPAESEQVIEY